MIKSVTALSFCYGLFSLHDRNSRDIGRLRVPCRIPNHSIIRTHGLSIAIAFGILQQLIIGNIGPILQLYYGGAKCTPNVNACIAQSLQHCKDQYSENLLQSIGQFTSEIHCRQQDIIRLKDHNLALKNEVTQLRIEIQLTRSMISGGLSIATMTINRTLNRTNCMYML
jgi:hypothetical protein